MSENEAAKSVRTRAVRSDAQRNREGILDAALRCLTDDPSASMATIAEAAQVGRVTLYGHFSSRAVLVETLFERTVRRADDQLENVDLSGEPVQALKNLTLTSWRIVDDFHSLLGAAEEELGNAAVRRHVDHALDRVGCLIDRGQRTRAFRGDLPSAWLTTCYYAILHSAASEARAGRIGDATAPGIVWESVLALVRIPPP